MPRTGWSDGGALPVHAGPHGRSCRGSFRALATGTHPGRGIGRRALRGTGRAPRERSRPIVGAGRAGSSALANEGSAPAEGVACCQASPHPARRYRRPDGGACSPGGRNRWSLPRHRFRSFGSRDRRLHGATGGHTVGHCDPHRPFGGSQADGREDGGGDGFLYCVPGRAHQAALIRMPLCVLRVLCVHPGLGRRATVAIALRSSDWCPDLNWSRGGGN